MRTFDKIQNKSCPFGHTCKECALYRPLYQKDKDGGWTQEWDCNINNIVELLSQTKGRLEGVQQAVEGRGNDTVAGLNKLLGAANGARRRIEREERQLHVSSD